VRKYIKKRSKPIWKTKLYSLDEKIKSINKLISHYNETFVKKQKIKFSDFFKGVEFNQSNVLNDDQIKAVITNDVNTLVVAGPGSGKTKLLTDRIAYYILKHKISPDKIIVLTYNVSASEEISRRLKKIYNISSNSSNIDSVNITTFHSIGYKILAQSKKTRSEVPRVEDNSRKVIRELIRDKKGKNSGYQQYYIDYFIDYCGELDFKDGKNLREDQLYYSRSLKYVSLDGTQVKSIAERDIANFFIQHGINYKYEVLVNWCDHDLPGKTYHPDFFLPDYDIYLEHWAVSDDDYVPKWFSGDTQDYQAKKKWKRDQFQKHNKMLWETDSSQWKNSQLESVLHEYCKNNEIPTKERTNEEIIKLLDRFPKKSEILSDSINSAIQTAKIYGYTPIKFIEYMSSKIKIMSKRESRFYKLVFPIFLEYEDYLKKNEKIDFEDMINQSVQILEKYNENSTDQRIPGYSMIMVDEFQDISHQRFELLKKLCSLKEDCRLFCVGDDWQAIYGFSGASNKYMVNFGKFIDHFTELKLNINYRNPSEIIQVGEEIIKKCKEYIPKNLVPVNNTILNPISSKILGSTTENVYKNIQMRRTVDLIKKLIQDGVDQSEIMVLSRFNFGYTFVKDICEKDPEINVELLKKGKPVKSGVRFYSMHKSKGLEADYVIILNLYNGLFGFPPQITDSYNRTLIHEDLTDSEDEERRLLFVALTRARKKVILFMWKGEESYFFDVFPWDKQAIFQYFGNLIRCRIINHTELALEVEVNNIIGVDIPIWIPKSVISSSYNIDSDEWQNITISEWWIEKNQDGF
jgi:DNA helicase-4